MAYIVVGSKFRPFSYEEMLKPLLQQTQVQQDLENQYGELATKAGIWEELANKQTDSRAYNMYKNYSKDLEKQAEKLAKEGLNASSRKDMFTMRTRYNKEIAPIEAAFNARNEEAKAQYEGRSKGIIYEGDASTSSLDRYLNNPSIRYSQADSQEGFKRVATIADALSKGLRDYGNGKRLDSFTKTWLQEHGYKDTDIGAAIADIRNIMSGNATYTGNNVLRNILNDEMRTAGLDTWNNRAAVMDYYNRVAPALYRAVGQTNVSPYADRAAIMAAEEASKKRLIDYERPQPNAFPMISREIPVGAAQNTDAAVANVRSRFGKLGVKEGSNTGGIVRVTVGNPTKVTSPSMAGSLYTGTKSINADLYIRSQGNRLKTKKEFINSGKTKEERDALGKYYDDNVQPILDKYNKGTSKGINYSTLNQIMSYEEGLIEENGTSTFADVMEIPLGDLEETEKGLASVAGEKVVKLTAGNNGWEEEGYAGNVASIIKDAKDNGKSLNTYMTTLEGKEGIMIKSNDDVYYFPFTQVKSSLSSDILTGINNWRESDNAVDKVNYGQGTMSRVNILLGGKYDRSTFKTSKQPTSSKN